MSLLLLQRSNFPIPCLCLCTRPGHGKLFAEQAWRWVEPDSWLCPRGPRGRNREPIVLAGPGRGVAWLPGCPGRAHPLASEELLPTSDLAPPRASRASERQHLCQEAVRQGDTGVSPPSSAPRCLWQLQAGRSSVTVASTSLSQKAPPS